MKRTVAWLAMSGTVPIAVFFAITSGPARVYAESAPPMPHCTDPAFEACDGEALNDTCAANGAFGLCVSSVCLRDGGAVSSALRCQVVPPCVVQSQLDDCTGMDAGAPCADASGSCESRQCPIVDGGEYDGAPMLACVSKPTPPFDSGNGGDAAVGADAGTTPTPDNGCSCTVTGASSKSVLGSIVGLLLAAAAVVRARHRSR